MMNRACRFRVALVVVLALGVAGARAQGQTLPPGFVDERVVGGLTEGLAFAFLPDGRVLIAEKSGLVRVMKAGALLPVPFIDLRNRVNAYWDRGLLGIAADPSFQSNGYVYLYYVYESGANTFTGPKTARLTRVTAQGDTANPATEIVLLGDTTASRCSSLPSGADCIPADSPSHNGGAIRFASDGTLFLSTGDGAEWNIVDDNALRAQDLGSLAGKVLRVTPLGDGLPTNPFWTGNPGANRSKVWAYGFRNPFRFGVRPLNDTPYVGDVGWNTWEEVNVAAGANYGWPCYEGTGRQSGYEPKALCQSLYAAGSGAVRPPIAVYPHNQQSAAVTGGAFYNGTAFPAEYQDAYFFGDYALGFISYLHVDSTDALIGSVQAFASGVGGPVDIQAGPDGALYYLAINAGELRRIRYSSTTPPPGAGPYLTDREWVSATNGWGPVERDTSNGEQAAGDGGPITLNGKAYLRGLGVHAPSEIRYRIDAGCSGFVADIGVDDEVGTNGSVRFEVLVDGIGAY
ncbi:MAG: hypothetical protein EHM13_01155, partial [Acidobacteria bacterium]